MLAPDGLVKQTEVPVGNGAVRRYNAHDGGVYTVADGDAAALRSAGFTDSPLTGAFKRSSGRRCRDCGFGSFFKTCSRCGGECEKEA